MARRRNSATSTGTRAVHVLRERDIPFETLEYTVAAGAAESTLGEAAAAALGVPAEATFKTLIAEIDGAPACAVVPVTGTLSLKALAAAFGGKRAAMAPPQLAERLTGYVTGGISPLGQTKALPTFVDASLELHDAVYVSAGKRGLQLRLAPVDLIEATSGTLVPGLAV